MTIQFSNSRLLKTALFSLLLLTSIFVAACGGPPGGGPPRGGVSIDLSARSADELAAIRTTAGLDISLFMDGALAEDVTTEDCTLSGGTETTCYRITLAGYPANHETGPFCPRNLTDSAEEGGIWFDGNGVYDLDGSFIAELAEFYADENWKLYNDDGSIRVTDTEEAFDGAARPNVEEQYQNHCVEGRLEWLPNGEPITTTLLIPTTPVPAEEGTAISRINVGLTLNGVVIAAPAPVDAILSAYTIAAFDDCGGHYNPNDGYHLHGARGCSEVGEADHGETPIFGYALDGYAIHSPLDHHAEDHAELDACNGHYTEALGYHYHANSAQDNAVLNCLTGEISQ